MGSSHWTIDRRTRMSNINLDYLDDNVDEVPGLSAGEQAAAGIFGTLGIVLVIAGLLYLLKRWMQGPQVTSQAKLDGKTVVITGSNTGIGMRPRAMSSATSLTL